LKFETRQRERESLVDYALSSRMPEEPSARSGTGGRVLWAVQGLLVGALALLSGISLKREAAIHSLNRDVGELRGLLISLAEREGTVEQELERGRRDLSAGELPEMYDVSYFEARGKHIPLGMYGGGEVLGDRRPAGPSQQQGVVNIHPGERYSASTAAPPQTLSVPRTYKKPELKSLGTPNQPTSPSTAIQLEAGDPTELRHDGRHTHWKLSRWARRLGAASSFPLSPGGEVGVPSPGLYLVFAQVSYLEKARQVGFSIEVNDRPKVECSERRGAGMQISCFTQGLLYLEQGDKVSLTDSSPASKVDSGLGRTFFGIVKLTGDWI